MKPQTRDHGPSVAPRGDSVLDRALKRLGRRYLDGVKVVAGVASGLIAGTAMIGYVFFGVQPDRDEQKVLFLIYLGLVVGGSAVDSVVFGRQTRRIRAFLEGERIGAPGRLLDEIASLGRETIARVAVVGCGMSAVFVLANSVVLRDPVRVMHAGIGASIAVSLQVMFSYLVTLTLSRPVYLQAIPLAQGVETLPTGRPGFLGRKLLYLTTSAQLIPLLFICAMVYQKARAHPDVAGVVDNVLAIATLSAAVFLGLAFYSVRAITGPMSRLAAAMDRIESGDLGARARVFSDDDLGRLAAHFNRMAGQLERDRAALRQANRELEQANFDLGRANQELAEKNAELQSWSDSLERRIAERTAELERTRQAAIHSEKMAALGILLSGVGHELNNPLGQVAGNAENLDRDLPALVAILKEGRTPEPAWVRRGEMMVRAIGNIVRGAGRMRSIVRSLEVLSRGSSDPVRRIRLHALVDEVFTLVRSDPRCQGVTLVPQVPADIEVDVFENGLLQVLLNLVTNAAHAAKGRGEIRVIAAIRGERLDLAVEDTGPGIPEEHLDRIFSPFFTTKAPGEGTGLGLSIVHDLVAEKHCGSIRAGNRPEGGARFDIEIPLDLAERYKKAA
ncbi:ATP-binding protein [Myxococcota bacterium]|nr:ATP-binding protein [Myxococcota bacterium]